MKFSLFIHMERFNQNKSYAQVFKDLVELVKIAEDGGFNTVWIGEHHAMEFTISPNPLTFLANLAPLTTRIRLGAGTLVAPFWHPIRLAGEAALVDIMCEGRLEVGLARGAYQFEFDRMLDAVPASDGGKYLREIVPLMQKLWQGDIDHAGDFYSFPRATSVPKPLQNKPHPPMWIAAREQASHEFAVGNGCNVMVTPLAKGDEEVHSLIGKFNDAVHKHPNQARPKVMVLQHLHIAQTAQQKEQAARAIQHWYATFAGWFKSDATPKNGFCDPVSEAEISSRPGFDLASLQNNLMIGSSQQITQRLQDYRELGVDEYAYWIDNSMSHEQKRASLKTFIAEVAPNLGG